MFYFVLKVIDKSRRRNTLEKNSVFLGLVNKNIYWKIINYQLLRKISKC